MNAPPRAPLARASRSVWALRRIAQDPIAFLHTLADQGDIVPFSIGRRQAFLLNHPAHIEEVLVSHHEKFVKGPAFERARRLLGNGLLTAEGPGHRRRRHLMQPALHRAQMERYGETMVACATRLRDTWQQGQPIDVAREMGSLTLAITGRTLFGVDAEPYASEVRRAVAMATASADPLVSLLAPLRRVDRARKSLEAVIDRMIEQCRRSGPGGNEGDDLLSLLLQAEDGDTPSRQLRDDALTILLAGHDTIANALTWAWTLLAEHPGVADRLARELTSVIGARPPATDDLARLTYTRNVLAESFRLFPPAWVIARLAVQPHRIGTTLIPAGSLVIVSQYLTHRDSAVLSRAARVQSRSLAARRATGETEAGLFSVWRRPEILHR